jgi:hypothetical protein
MSGDNALQVPARREAHHGWGSEMKAACPVNRNRPICTYCGVHRRIYVLRDRRYENADVKQIVVYKTPTQTLTFVVWFLSTVPDIPHIKNLVRVYEVGLKCLRLFGKQCHYGIQAASLDI